MKWPRYPRYKPSGVEWLGDVPKHWEVKRLKFELSKMEQGWSPQCDNSPADEGEWDVLKVGAVNGNEFDPRENKRLPPDETPLPEFEIRAGDFLISRANTRELLGSAALVREVQPHLLLCDKLYRLSIKHPLLDSEFLLRFMRCKSGHFEFERDASGSSASMQNIGQQSVRNLRIPLPPLAEQRDIAAFLDRETGRIDRLMGKKRELIERLQEKRTALISRTVRSGLPSAEASAAGLNPHPKLKPSHIDWLGDIPENWKVKKLSWLFRYAKGPSAAMLTKEYVADNRGDFPVFSGQTENEGLMGMIDWHEFDFAQQVIFVTTVGARAMTTRLVSGKFSLSQNCALIIPRSNATEPRFYEPVLRCLFDYERRSISLIMQPSLRFDDLDKFRIPLPPPNEQLAIAAYLDRETAKLDALVAKVEMAIERLLEYRTALITAAVTGKIDVRMAARP